MIRAAQFGDIPRLTDILIETHSRSVYAGKVSVDEKEAKRLLVQSVQRNGMKGEGGTLFYVHEKDGRVEGMLILTFQRLYLIGDALMATDMFFVVTPLGDARAASMMLKRALMWCAKVPEIVDVYMNMTGVAGDPARTGRLLERCGFKPTGTIYRKEMP